MSHAPIRPLAISVILDMFYKYLQKDGMFSTVLQSHIPGNADLTLRRVQKSSLVVGTHKRQFDAAFLRNRVSCVTYSTTTLPWLSRVRALHFDETRRPLTNIRYLWNI